MTITVSEPVARRASPRVRGKAAAPKSIQIRKILVPLDFSEPSRDAVEFSLPLLQRFGAELHLVHVVPPDYPLSGLEDLPLVVPEIEIGRRIRRHLKDAAHEFSVELRRENIHALKGRPFEEICRLARDLDIDLIITSTRGLTGLKHLTLGSTAERIVRYSTCPVLVVRHERKAKKGKITPRRFGFAKILVPIDFSECSMKGLEYAKVLARQFQSKLVLVHSVHVEYYVTSDEYARFDLPLVMEEAEKASRQQMRDLVQKTDWDGIQVETSLQVGHPGEQICAKAEKAGADLIVTSTHGKTGLKHVFLGSTAEYVVRHASCPILIVPSQPRPASTAAATRI